jgi:hypothetical protein
VPRTVKDYFREAHGRGQRKGEIADDPRHMQECFPALTGDVTAPSVVANHICQLPHALT